MPTQHTHQSPHRTPHPHPGPAGAELDESAMADLLDLDAEVLHGYLSGVTAWAAELAADRPPLRILDLGSGTGTGAFALLRRFPDARVIAVDLSAQMLDHLRARSADLGMADRVRTVQADLDDPWPDLDSVDPDHPGDSVDLVWAGASLHHMADPDRVLTDVLTALRPGGLLVVAEMDASPFPRFLPDDIGIGRPGLEARAHAALAHRHSEQVPELGADWGPRLSDAGFTVEGERRVVIDLAPPLPTVTGRYAQASLNRIRPVLEDLLDAEDLTSLDTLLADDEPDSLLRRTDLTIRTSRRTWVARRP